MKKNLKKTNEVVETLKKTGTKSDTQGSYTGRPSDKHEKPVQDADDM